MIEIIGILLCFILGIISSYPFWKYLLFLKPRLKISPYILKGRSLKPESETIYRLKIFNDSNRPIVNLNIIVLYPYINHGFMSFPDIYEISGSINFSARIDYERASDIIIVGCHGILKIYPKRPHFYALSKKLCTDRYCN